jgi:hypothetical protein
VLAHKMTNDFAFGRAAPLGDFLGRRIDAVTREGSAQQRRHISEIFDNGAPNIENHEPNGDGSFFAPRTMDGTVAAAITCFNDCLRESSI